MACATLKRNLDWESMSQMPAKRMRCSPFSPSTSSSSPGLKIAETRVSPFGDSNVGNPKLTPERMAQEICDEIKRLHHRKQLRLRAGNAGAGGSGGGPSSQRAGRADSDGSSSGSEGDSPHHPHARALFTFKQVRVICERMLREQEAALRTEYEAALSGRLAEQYDTFVRFNLDQVQRLHHNAQDLTYLS